MEKLLATSTPRKSPKKVIIKKLPKLEKQYLMETQAMPIDHYLLNENNLLNQTTQKNLIRKQNFQQHRRYRSEIPIEATMSVNAKKKQIVQKKQEGVKQKMLMSPDIQEHFLSPNASSNHKTPNLSSMQTSKNVSRQSSKVKNASSSFVLLPIKQNFENQYTLPDQTTHASFSINNMQLFDKKTHKRKSIHEIVR